MLLTPAFLQSIGPLEYGIIAIVLLLLFGRRLPEVGRSLGQGIVQFKRGLREVQDEVNVSGDDRRDDRRESRPSLDDRSTPADRAGERTQTAESGGAR